MDSISGLCPLCFHMKVVTSRCFVPTTRKRQCGIEVGVVIAITNFSKQNLKASFPISSTSGPITYLENK